MDTGRSPAALVERPEPTETTDDQPSRPPPAWGRLRRWRVETTRPRSDLPGILAAGVLCFALAAATAVRLPVFFGADERNHLAYVVYVLEGDLPEVEDPIPTADGRFPVLARSHGLDEPPDEHEGPLVGVANHPPMMYVLAAPAVWLSSQVGDDTLPALTVRLLNAGLMAAGVVLTGLLARALFPRKPGIGVLAAGLTAVTPNLVGVSAYGHNDGLAFALAAGALLLMTLLLRRGPQARLLVAAALLAAACGLSRASMLVAAVGLVGASVLGGLRMLWRRRRRGQPLRARSWSTWCPLLAGGLVGVSVALSSGWFYLRNQRLYGSPTADELLLETYRRNPRGSMFDVLRDREFYTEMWTDVYGSVHPDLVFDRSMSVVKALILVGLAGLVVGLWRRWRGRPADNVDAADAVDTVDPAGAPETADADPDAAPGPRPDAAGDGFAGVGVVGWTLFAGYSTAVTVGVADFVSKGGGMHPRYFFAVLPLVSSLLAVAIRELPLRRLVGLAAVGGLLAVTLGRLADYPELIELREANDMLSLPDRPAGLVVHWVLLGVGAVAQAALAVELLQLRVRAATIVQGKGARTAVGSK